MKEDHEITYIVTEMCPHCMTEIEMRWDTDTMGFQAFCPVCGGRLMLCDECRHIEAPCPCDHDAESGTCCKNETAGARDGYIVLCEPSQAVGMIADLGNGPTTVNGDRSSQYFVIAKGRRSKEQMVSVSLIENIYGLAEDERYYTLHLVDDVSGVPCELYHTDDLSEGSLVALMKEIIEAMKKGGDQNEPGKGE